MLPRLSLSSIKRSSSHVVPKLMTPSQLIKAIEKPNHKFKVLDASWHMPNANRSPLTEFEKGPRLPNAVFFDHDKIADLSYPGNLPHMRPDPETFQAAMNGLGISPSDTVVVYDSLGIFSAPRAAWLLHSFHHPSIAVLDGGLPRWIAEGFPTESGPSSSVPKSDYQLIGSREECEGKQFVTSYDDIVTNITDQRMEILDARPQPRFEGTAPEPRASLSSGHIPGSLSLPFSELLTTHNQGYRTFLSPEKLEEVFISCFGSAERWEAVKQGEKPLIASCGSGMTACIIWLAIQICSGTDQTKVKIYDESWTGYASRSSSPIAITQKHDQKK
ncbi:Rhodanese-like domain-containing protein [Melampsora americana]|nr:Rhodanese-like domain-containing protein [Melampsora americana]